MKRNTPTKPIVVAVDGSPHSNAAIDWAARECVLRGATVELVHVVDRLPASGANANTVLAQADARFRTASRPSHPACIATTLVEAPVIPTLIDSSERAQLIVVGSHGMGIIGRVLGSASSAVVHHALCPVAVIPLDEARWQPNDHPVVVGVDGSPASERAIALAFDEAARRGAKLVAVHAWSDVGVSPFASDRWHDRESEARELVEASLTPWQEKYPGVVVERRVVCDVAAHAVIAESRYSQLVVVGSRGGGGATGIQLGSVSRAVAHASPAPVIIQRGH